MKASVRLAPGLVALVVLAVVAVMSTACGASIQAIYEGDVRFEHCMALDARPDVKPTLRRACWEEWVKFYTFGQTRDRVDYAGLRQAQLGSASDFDEGEWGQRHAAVPLALPEPTGALAPPPMMLALDGGVDSGAPAAPKASAEPNELRPGAECAASCEGSLGSCRRECTGAGCGKVCAAKYQRCLKRCF